MTATCSVEEASKMWSVELEQIHQDLTDASTEIQSSFAGSSNSIADPIKILQRIAALESTIKELNSECQEYVRRRPILAEEVTSLLLKNFKDIEELTVLAKGRKASLDPNLKRLAITTHGQNESWKQCLERRQYECKESNNDDDEAKNGNGNYPVIDESDYSHSYVYSQSHHDTTIDGNDTVHTSDSTSMDTDVNGTSYIDDDTGNISITQDQFQCIPSERRGRCKLDHIQKVASFIYQEVTARYLEGYRGKKLSVERQQIVKYSGAYPGLHAVIMNHSLWRDIISSLQFLGFVRVDNDGTLTMTGVQ